MNHGVVFNIQRFSINDGPGIRTTVYFKGCPLHCAWCHNPESISAEQELALYSERCIQCQNCSTVCRQHAIESNGNGVRTLREKCIRCGECVNVCMAEARALMGREIRVDEVVEEITKDIAFYHASNGGVTFSGGEPLLQHEFLDEVLLACKKENIHTAVDTSGYTSPRILKQIASHTDLFLFDIKHLDPVLHKQYTGVSNEIILENLRHLVDWKKEIFIRIPLVPGVNDDEKAIHAIGRFIYSLESIKVIHLLPYHQTGLEKYSRIGIKSSLASSTPPTDEMMRKISKTFQQYVPSVLLGG